MKLSIIIPAYNEEKRILPVLENYYSYFSNKLGTDFEMIIVPNNSSDKTEFISKNFGKGKGNVKVIIIPPSQGYVGKGYSVLRGFREAKGDLIGFSDADGSTPPEEFFKLIQPLQKFDGAIASRKKKGAVVNPPRRTSQEISSLLFNSVVKLLFGLPYKDTQCGAKIFKRDLINIFLKRATQNYWMFDVELLYLSKRFNKKVLEVPIKWTDAEGSHLTFLAGIKSIFDLVTYRLSTIF